MRCLMLLAILGACSSSSKHDDGPAVAPQAHDKAPTTAATPPPAPMPKVRLSSPQGDVPVDVEIVSTTAQIERGLMYREHLPPDQGMLFLLPEEKDWPFWMQNTLIPLDIIFIARDMTIAGVAANAEPRSETLRQVGKPSVYVLEVNGGFCAAHKIGAGTKVAFDGVTR